MRVASERRGDAAGSVEIEIGDDDAGALGRELAGDRRPERPGAAGDDGDSAVEPVRMDHEAASCGARRRRSTHTIRCDSSGRRVDVVGIEQPLVADPSERSHDRRPLRLRAGAGDDRPVAQAAADEAGHVGPHRAVELDEVGAQLGHLAERFELEGVERAQVARVALGLARGSHRG